MGAALLAWVRALPRAASPAIQQLATSEALLVDFWHFLINDRARAPPPPPSAFSPMHLSPSNSSSNSNIFCRFFHLADPEVFRGCWAPKQLRIFVGGVLARRARAGRAPGIFFDPCPTVDLGLGTHYHAKSMGKVKAKYRLLSTIQMTFGVVEFTAIA